MMDSDKPIALLGLMAGVAYLAIWVEKTKIGRSLSGVVVAVFVAAALSQFGVLPSSAPLYDNIWSYGVPLAIALFLLKADLVGIYRESGRILAAFALGVIGATGGAYVGAMLLDAGPLEAEIAAVFAATYTGGSLNFAATAEAIGFTDSTQLAAALAVDNIMGTLLLVAMIYFVKRQGLQNYFPWRAAELEQSSREHIEAEAQARRPELGDIFAALAIGAGICVISSTLATVMGYGSYSILFVTVLSVLLATLFRDFFSRLSGEELIAMMLMYFFFIAIGVDVSLPNLLNGSPSMVGLILFIFFGHFLFLYLAGRFLKLNYAELLVASVACILGPPVAAAIAGLFGWRSLLVPGVMTGILGYVIGTFIGVGLFTLIS
ncbi:MAG: DUF819 family protein [Pseudomonadota bacterium]